MLFWAQMGLSFSAPVHAAPVEEAPDPRLAEASALDVRAAAMSRDGRYSEGADLARQSVDLRRTVLGREHPDLAQPLNELALLLLAQGLSEDARLLFEESLALSRAAPRPDDAVMTMTLNHLGLLLERQGDQVAAGRMMEEGLAIRRSSLGSEHPDVAASLNNLAGLRVSQGNYAAARTLFEESLAIRRTALGPDHQDVAQSLNNLAGLLESQGDYTAARPLFEESLGLLRATVEPNHPHIGTSLNNLAGVLRAQGDYVAARRLYEESLAIRRDALGSDHPHVAQSLNGLALLLEAQGDSDAARRMFEESLTILRAALGADHPYVALLLNNLAARLREDGDYDGARPLYEESLAIKRATLGPEHPGVALGLNNLAVLLSAQGDHEGAWPLYEESLALRRAALGPDHPHVAQSMGNLAGAMAGEGDHAGARPLYEESLALLRAALGPDHPAVARRLGDLALMLEALGEGAAGRSLRDEALGIVERRLELLDAMSEREALLYLREQRPVLDTWLVTHNDDPESAWTHSLRFKGTIGAGLRAAHALSASDAETAAVAADLTAVRRELARIAIASTARGPDPARLEALTADSERLQRELLARSARYRADRAASAVTAAELCAALPEGTAMIDLLRYQRGGEAHYVAFSAMEGACVPVRTELGPAALVDEAVADWRAVLSDPDSLGTRVDARGKRLTDLFWAPLRPAVAGATEVLVVPDGPLSTAPLGALPVGDGRYLLEDVAVTYLDRANDLLLAAEGAPPSGAVVVGGVDYDGAETVSASEGSVRGAMAACNEGGFWALPATLNESAAVSARWRRARRSDPLLLDRAAATETAIAAAMPGKAVVHLATHGFFATGRCKSALHGNGYDPMLLSGLVLAGANQSVDPLAPEDGVLTAAEVASLDLSGTGLVVLSACETGLGEIRSGEGVLGLRRAFAIAGAHGQVMSLWSVSDDATAALMDEMYRYYLRSRKPLSAPAALRQAQIQMLGTQRRRGDVLPQEWAAFIATESRTRR